MFRLIIISVLATLFSSGLTAQEQLIEYAVAAPAWSHASAARGLACSACHQSSIGGLDLSVANTVHEGGSPRYYELALNGKTPGVQGNAAIRLGKVTFVPLASDLVRSHLPIDKEPAWMVSAAGAESDPLKRGDIVLTVNSIPVSDHAKIVESVEENRAKPVRVVLIRGGKRLDKDVTGKVLARPEQPFRIGVQVEQPSEALRSQLNLYENEGLLITDVVEDSPAEKSGFQKHDILLRAGSQRISTLDDLRACVNESNGNAIELTLMRGGKETKLSATPERQEAVDAVIDVYSVCPRVSSAELLLLDRSVHAAGSDEVVEAQIEVELSESQEPEEDDE